jgi:hypothetical protein
MSDEPLIVSKPAWASKGVIGSVVVILVSAISLAGMFIPSLRDLEIDKDGLVEVISQAAMLIFGAIALWGRISAKSPVHFRNRKTVPGGEFNPDAEIRRAEPAHRPVQAQRPHKGGFGKGGYVRLPALVAGIIWVLAFLAIVMAFHLATEARAGEHRKEFQVQRYPDITETPNLGGWIKFREVVDARPFVVRLVQSLRPWAEVGTDKGSIKVDEERPSVADLMPQSVGVGVSGGADF